MANDQLVQLKDKSALLQRFSEGPLNFNPTFKYDADSDIYDSSKKMRVPSWTDRILFKPDNCNLEYYNRVDSKFSDHRPVVGIFTCTVVSLDRRKKEEVTAQVVEYFNKPKSCKTDINNQ